MADFCQRAMAYMTGRSLEEFAKKKTAALTKDLLALLHARPWLFVLDGLERVLVHYHRIDAAEMADEEANSPTDKIVKRDPCDAIRDEDNDLLRALACRDHRRSREFPAHSSCAAERGRPNHSRRSPHQPSRPATGGCRGTPPFVRRLGDFYRNASVPDGELRQSPTRYRHPGRPYHQARPEPRELRRLGYRPRRRGQS